MKKVLVVLYVAVVAVMAAATFVEKFRGTQYVSENVYGAWWFSLLWATLTAVAVFWFLKQRVRRLSVVVLHVSFMVILLGAFLTHVTARRGIIHLRQGETTNIFTAEDMSRLPLPFSIRLNRFDVSYYAGTQTAADYRSDITIIDGGNEESYMVSMNNIATCRGFRLYQASYDSDMRGTMLAVNSDPWGIPVTYTGYALLFLGLVWMLVDPKGTYRQLLRRSAVLSLLCFVGSHAVGQPTLPSETADKLGRLHVVYNGRIAPVQTYALDFVKKVYGRRTYQGLSAEQVLSGFLFWSEEWSCLPVIRVKSSAVRSVLDMSEYCCVNDFFSPDGGGYVLGPYVREYYEGKTDVLHKDIAKLDDVLMLIMELRSGAELTRMTRHVGEYARAGQFGQVDRLLDELQQQQQRSGQLPSPLRQWAERMGNSIPLATILFMVNLTAGVLSLLLFGYRGLNRRWTFVRGVPVCLSVVSFSGLTFTLALRWMVTGHIPMANGYETMLTLAWLILLLSMATCRAFPIATGFGLLLSGFFLLVCHISQMNPQTGYLMPVLNSPLLSLHVGIVMTAYALLAMTFGCGVAALILCVRPSFRCDDLTRLSLIMLYPALATLGMGIFIGAIWANISWGTYWSWDPKEVWALITFMVYAVPVHRRLMNPEQRPVAYHLYMTLAFLTVLMTYFGVNYYLGGLHGYA